MNNKKLKKLLVDKAEQVEIKDCRAQIIQNTHHRVQPKVEQQSKVSRPTKQRKSAKWLYPVCAVAVVLCLVCVLIPFVHGGGNKPPVQLSVGKAEQVMSREVLALGNIVSALDNNQMQPMVASMMSCDIALTSDDDEEDDEEQTPDGETHKTQEQIAQEINQYLLASESFLNKSAIDVKYDYNTNDSFSKYKYMMTITYQDSYQHTVRYVAYFNQDEENGGKKAESKFEMQGVLVTGEGNAVKQYAFKSERTTKQDEVEMETKVYLNQEKTSYISVENESGAFENEFEYKFVENGKLIKSVEMEVENENGRKTSSIEIIEQKDGVKSTTECEFEFVSDKLIECQYTSGKSEIQIKIDILDKAYRYTFEDNQVIELGK